MQYAISTYGEIGLWEIRILVFLRVVKHNHINGNIHKHIQEHDYQCHHQRHKHFNID